MGKYNILANNLEKRSLCINVSMMAERHSIRKVYGGCTYLCKAFRVSTTGNSCLEDIQTLFIDCVSRYYLISNHIGLFHQLPGYGLSRFLENAYQAICRTKHYDIQRSTLISSLGDLFYCDDKNRQYTLIYAYQQMIIYLQSHDNVHPDTDDFLISALRILWYYVEREGGCSDNVSQKENGHQPEGTA